MEQYSQYACSSDANNAIERMQQRQESPHDPQITILSDKIYSQESNTFDANTWCMILRDLVNIQKETSPNQFPFSILELYKKIFKKLDTLIEQEQLPCAQRPPSTLYTLVNMATGPLVQQALVDSKNLSILKKILIYTLVNEQHSIVQDLKGRLSASKADHSPTDSSGSSQTTPETKEYAPKAP